jgi:hypothetical protein
VDWDEEKDERKVKPEFAVTLADHHDCHGPPCHLAEGLGHHEQIGQRKLRWTQRNQESRYPRSLLPGLAATLR